MTKLSIITINFNNCEGLKKTVGSVITQTYKDFEYIIVDGGSSDGSSEFIENSAKEEEQVKIVWVSERDKGIYNAMNKGIKMSNGEYLQFLNSGDILVDENVTEKMIKALKPDSKILYGNMLKLLPKGLYRDKGFDGRKPTFIDFFYGTLNHSSAYLKKELFEKYGNYDENLKIVSDWKWYLKTIILTGINIEYVNIDVSLFDMNGISNVNNKLEKEERQKVLIEMVPERIYADYENWGYGLLTYQRYKKFPFIFKIFSLFDRYVCWLERRRYNNYLKK